MQQDIRRSNNRRLLVTHSWPKPRNNASCELRFVSSWPLRCTSRSLPRDSPPPWSCNIAYNSTRLSFHSCSCGIFTRCAGTVRGRCTARRCGVCWNVLASQWRIPAVQAPLSSCVLLELGHNWAVLCVWWRRVDSDWQCVKPYDCDVPLEVTSCQHVRLKNVEFFGDKEWQYGDVRRRFVSSYMYCALKKTVKGWKICSAFAKLRKANISFFMPVCPSIFLLFRMEQVTAFRGSLSEYCSINCRANCSLHADRYTFMIISRSVLTVMRNVSHKCVQKIKTRVLGSVNSFRKSCHLWDKMQNIVQVTRYRWQRGECAVHAGKLMLQTHIKST